MPNPTILAAGEAMPAAGQNRRRFLSQAAIAIAGGAVAGAALPAGGALASADPLIALIEDHRRAFAYANEPGASDEETAARVAAEDAALWALAETEPQTIEGASRLLDYIANYDNGCFLTAEMHCVAMQTVANALAKMEGIHG